MTLSLADCFLLSATAAGLAIFNNHFVDLAKRKVSNLKKSDIQRWHADLGRNNGIVGIQLSDGWLPHFIHFNLGSYSSEGDANDAFIKMETANFWSVGYKNLSPTR